MRRRCHEGPCITNLRSCPPSESPTPVNGGLCHSYEATAGSSPVMKTLYTLLGMANEAQASANMENSDLINFKARILCINIGEMQKVQPFFPRLLIIDE